MRLSEAMALGKMAFKFDAMKYVSRGVGCGLGLGFMAATGITDWAAKETVYAEWPWLSLCEANTIPKKWWKRLLPLSTMYDCYSFGRRIEYGAFAVARHSQTFSKLCDQVRAWEDELAAKGINVEQVTMAAELNQPASPIQSIQESPESLEQDVAK